MPSTLAVVLGAILVYTLLAMALRARGLLPAAVRVNGPITTLHTQRGKAFLDWLASPRRAMRAWGNFGVGIALVVLVGSFLAVLGAAVSTLRQPEATAISEPQNVLVIPGVNEFLPLAAAPEILFGLVVALVVHEGGHGLLCRVEDIDIDSMGLAFIGFIPVGAFVDPDDESRRRTDRGAQTRMFAAGVTNNFAVSVLAFLLLFGPVVGVIQPAQGAPVGDVAPGSAAETAGIERGDVITAVNGTAVSNGTELEAALEGVETRAVSVTLQDGETVAVERRLILTRTGPSAAADLDLTGPPPVITAVNGTAVDSEAAFFSAVANRTRARIETRESGQTTVIVGALVGVIPDGPLARAGAKAGEALVLTSVDGHRIVNHDDLDRALSRTEPNETVTVIGYREGNRRTYEVRLGRDDGDPETGFLGVRVQRGVAGLTVDDFGADIYPAREYLGLLGGDAGGPFGSGTDRFFQRVFLVLFLPFATAVDPSFTYNFAGFVGPIRNFYVATGPLGSLGGVGFTLANLLFWTGWVNIQLGFFNCIPAFPLDGGHILRTGTESVVSRLPISGRRSLTSALTTAVSVVMLVGVVVMVFGARILG